jgi:hypothetical protein
MGEGTWKHMTGYMTGHMTGHMTGYMTGHMTGYMTGHMTGYSKVLGNRINRHLYIQEQRTVNEMHGMCLECTLFVLPN